ncbi:MAG: hypothetical protein J0L99_19110 [Chitinophagales bacterium]|nr:hypothetical protein [Chitinophagales bacterium]
MRIIGTLPHPTLRISVFRNDGRSSIKFENEHYEQSFKLGSDDRFLDWKNIEQLVDAQMIQQVQETFQRMHRNRLESMARFSAAQEASLQFDEII